MANQLWTFFNNKKSLLSAVLFTCLIFTTLFIQSLSTDINRLSVLHLGIGTCFERVQQSFTSNLLGQVNSGYLNDSFMSNTEECISDVMEMAESNFKQIFNSNLKRLNSLASDLHWFHKKLSGQDEASLIANPKEHIQVSLMDRFSKLERLKDEILTINNEVMVGIKASLSSSKIAFYLLVIFLPFFMLWEYFEKKDKKFFNNTVDEKAHNILLVGGVNGSQKLEVERIIRRALEQNNLRFCAKLFANYQEYNESYFKNTSARVSFDQAARNSVAPNSNLAQAVHCVSEENIEQKINDIWNERNAPEYNENIISVSLQTILSKVIDGLAQTLQGQGVLLEVNVDDEKNVYAEVESLEQVFYYLLTDSINECLKTNNSRSIKISSTILGGSYILEFSHSGTGFDKDFLDAQSGLVAKKIEEYLGIGLQISYAFMQDFHGKIDFENSLTEDGDVIGAKYRLLFNIAKSAKKSKGANLVQLTKGRKSEILEQMSRS